MDKLLIIEDDTTLANILNRRMSQHGFECHVAHDATQGLLLARQHLPSHILLDMKLEHSNSLNLVKPLRQLLPKATLVFLTGYASIATAVEAIRLGADNYLSKPVDTQTLLKALDKKHLDIADEVMAEPPITPQRLEWEHLQQVLQINNGNVSETARQLGMHRRTLQRKLLKKPTSLKCS